jgi:hypothetical protein
LNVQLKDIQARCRCNSSNVAVVERDGCNGLTALVAQPGRGLSNDYDVEMDEKIKSLGGDLNPRPLPLEGRLFEPNLTKVTLYQADLFLRW